MANRVDQMLHGVQCFQCWSHSYYIFFNILVLWWFISFIVSSNKYYWWVTIYDVFYVLSWYHYTIFFIIIDAYVIFLNLLGFVYHSEDCLLYYPDLPDDSRIFVPQPSMYGLPYENIFIKSLDGTRVHLFLIKQPGDISKIVPTILFLHGNAGNMGHRLEYFNFFTKMFSNR